MSKIDPTDKVIQMTIYDKPHLVAKMLKDSGYRVSNKPTLHELTEKTMIAIYSDANVEFSKKFDNLVSTGEYNNFIGVAVGIASAVASGILGSKQAQKQRALQMRIAQANLEQDKLLAEEQIRMQGELGRIEILSNTLLSYRTALQSESTQRQKNVYLYLIGIGGAISIIYGTNLILK